MSRRPREGDVLEAKAPEGFFYVQYLGKHPSYGGAVLVCPRKFSNRCLPTAMDFRDGYAIFYPASTAFSRGLMGIVGHLPAGPVPVRLRRAGARSADGKVKTWIVEDASGVVVKEKLSAEERLLPIAAIWNHEFLIQRVTEGWRPETDV
jgi:hypothetical protein